jgi:hypothetical protein
MSLEAVAGELGWLTSEVSRIELAKIAVTPADVRALLGVLDALLFAAGAHPGVDGSFTVLEFTDSSNPRIVYLDRMTNSEYLDGLRDVAAYRHAHDQLRATDVHCGRMDRIHHRHMCRGVRLTATTEISLRRALDERGHLGTGEDESGSPRVPRVTHGDPSPFQLRELHAVPVGIAVSTFLPGGHS